MILVLFLNPGSGIAQENKALQQLKTEIEKAPRYDARKLEQIDSLRKLLQDTETEDLRERYDLNQQLFNEYKIFKRDSAFTYGLQTRQLAHQLNDKALIASATVNLADISVSAGMYKEALDFMGEVDPEEIPKNIRSLYFGLLGRCYSEMAEYSNLPFFSEDYKKLASQYRNNALSLTDEGTFFNSFLKAFIEYKEGNEDSALEHFHDLTSQQLGLREEALVYYMLGEIYSDKGKNDKAVANYSHSAIADVKTSTKENLAIIRLAELLFKTEDIQMASLFIQKANADAKFYGAQQRKIRVGAILPLIEEKVVQKIEKQRERLYWQNIIMGFLLIFVIALAAIIYAQVTKLKKARKIILAAHEKLQETNKQIIAVNEQIKSTNSELKKVNGQLLEANKIKEEYIGFFFTQDADIFEKFRGFKVDIEKNLAEKKYEKVKYLVSKYDLKKEKQKLLEDFDEAFIRLFPNFIEEFNSLLEPGEQIKVKKGQLLNKELRIFALIRLGIKHNEIIAQILGYSVNSIYAYKTKIRKKSRVDTSDFDQKLIENTTLKL